MFGKTSFAPIILLALKGQSPNQPKPRATAPAPIQRQRQPDTPRRTPAPTAPAPGPTNQGGGGIGTGTAVGIGIGSAIAGAVAARALTKPEDAVKLLDQKGPHLADRFTMSSLTVRGFVKGNWPAVVEYTVTQPRTMVILSVTSDNGVDAWYLLPPGPGRVQVRLNSMDVSAIVPHRRFTPCGP